MSGGSAALIELILVFGAVLAFGFWELYTLRRDRKRTREDGNGDDPPPDQNNRRGIR